jgi:hypothetical protein
MKENEKTNLDVPLEASFKNCTGPLKERLARKGNLTTSQFLLEHVKLGIQELDPDLDPKSQEFRTAVILMAAAYMVGPRIDLLVAFTGYPLPYVAEISRRMRANGLWSDVGVSTAGWFEGDRVTGVFWADCLVADGLVHVGHTEEGEEEYGVIPSESESKPN